MVCPSCQTAAPPGANFCPACGTRLAAACARCGGQLPPGARFCPACGSPAEGGGPMAEQDRSSAPAVRPPPSAGDAETELRLVTVLFADVHSFTTLSERLSPEAITELMNRCFGSIIPEIARFGGSVDKYVGDAVMARFGAPVAHEDDPERAIHAALGMQRALARLGSELAPGPGLELRMRIGINTGPVLAGEVGAETHREYTLMGDAVNIASRLEHECPLGGVLVGETTYRLAWRAFRFDSPRPLQLKGKSAPVNAYPVLGEAGEAPEQPSGRAAPLVGRSQELALLSEAAERASAGQGRVVLVLGEPGVGKSRLLAELRSRLERPNGGLAFALARCQSYRQNVAYAALGQLVRSAAGLETVGDPSTGSELAPSASAGPSTSSGRAVASAAERLGAWLAGIFGQLPQAAERVAEVREALLDLLGLLPQTEAEQLEPRQRQARLARAFKDLVAALGARSPLALVVEDLHWIDESSLDVLDELVDALPGLPVLLLALSRPERLPPWVSRSWYRQLTLSPLQGEQGHELLSALLAGWEVSPGLAQRLLERTGGNPFFLEEVVASLREAGALQAVDGQWALVDEERADLPATVQEVLLARLDRLERPVRAVLQTASVIGRSFGYRLLRSVSEANGALDDALRALRRHEFVFESVLGGPEPLYSFKHAITQEVVYSSLLRARRRELHLRVAAALERAPGDGAEPPHVLLAHHYLQAEAWERALPNLLEAARRAKQRYANEEALALFGRALEILERAANGQVAELEPGAARLAIFDLLSERQGVFGVLARYAEQRADLERMRGLAEAEGDDRRLSDALNGLADSYYRTGDLAATRVAAEAALGIKARLGDRAGEADALSNIAPLYAALGDFEAAKAANRRALEIREAIGAERGQIRSLDNLGVNHLYIGEFTVARGYFERALARARAIGYKGHELQATIHVAAASAQLGEADRARACAERALALAREMGDRAGQGWAWLLVGWAETEEDGLEAAEQAYGRALELARATGSNELEVRTLNWLGCTLLDAGRPAEALERLEHCAELAEAAGFTLDDIQALAGAAAAALDDGQPELARSHAERALAALGSIEPGVLLEGQYVAWCLYRVFHALGDARAEPFREQARAIVRRRADAIGEPGRRLYLGRPFIRAIVEEQ